MQLIHPGKDFCSVLTKSRDEMSVLIEQNSFHFHKPFSLFVVLESSCNELHSSPLIAVRFRSVCNGFWRLYSESSSNELYSSTLITVRLESLSLNYCGEIVLILMLTSLCNKLSDFSRPSTSKRQSDYFLNSNLFS